LGGGGNSSTWVDMYHPKIGAIDPSKFAVPSGQCINVPGSFFLEKPNKFGIFTQPLEMLKSFLKESLTPTPIVEVPKSPLVSRQQIPQLAQAFTAKMSLVINATYDPPFKPYTITGQLGFDFTKTGFYFMIEDFQGAIPFSLKTGVVISPDRNGFEILLMSPEGNCYGSFFIQWIFTFLLPPYQIPPDAIYMGTAVVDGFQCSVWNYYWGAHNVNLYVRIADGVPIKGEHSLPYVGMTVSSWHLTDIQLSVNPALYSRPPSCVELDTWNPSFQSHLPWYWCSPICDFLEPMRKAVLSLL